MKDIFDAKVLCEKCGKQMEKDIVKKRGFELRTLRCKKCGEVIVHPEDKHAFEHFNDLKGKTFSVKMRMVGNSHTISIPKEIVNFMNEMHRDMQREMERVRLSFQDFGKISLNFNEDEDKEDEFEKLRRRDR